MHPKFVERLRTLRHIKPRRLIRKMPGEFLHRAASYLIIIGEAMRLFAHKPIVPIVAGGFFVVVELIDTIGEEV